MYGTLNLSRMRKNTETKVCKSVHVCVCGESRNQEDANDEK